MFEDIARFEKERCLVSIRRSEIDSAKIQGFILEYSEDLLLLQYISDFRIDGLLVLRVSDITEILCDKTNRLQMKILINEGIFEKVDFKTNYNLSGWSSVFSGIAPEFELITIEDEPYSIIMIGKLEQVKEESVVIHEFTGAARWLEDMSEMYFEDISSFQVGNHYAAMYQRYFQVQP